MNVKLDCNRLEVRSGESRKSGRGFELLTRRMCPRTASVAQFRVASLPFVPRRQRSLLQLLSSKGLLSRPLDRRLSSINCRDGLAVSSSRYLLVVKANFVFPTYRRLSVNDWHGLSACKKNKFETMDTITESLGFSAVRTSMIQPCA